MAADGQAEIGRVGLPYDLDSAQRSTIVPGRSEDSRNAANRAKIGVGEGIVSLHSRVARAYFVQWSKPSRGVNVAEGLGIN